MKKEIFREFDGYDRIVEERDFSRKYGLDYSAQKNLADPYIEHLHPRRLSLRVSDIITETPSAKTLRLVSPDGYLPPFLAGQYIALFWKLTVCEPAGLTASPHRPTRQGIMT